MSLRRCLPAFLAGLACLPCGATQLDVPDAEQYVRWGPLRVRPGLELADLGYDDNILSSNTQRVSDMTATLSPKLDGLVLLGHPAFLTFREKLEYTSYLHHGDQSFWNQRGNARLVFPLRRIGLFAEARLDRLKERPIDQQDLRPHRNEDELRVGAVFKPRWRTEFEVSQDRRRYRYSDPDTDPLATPTIGQRLDRHEDTTRLGLRYLLVGRTRLTFDAEIQTVDFANTPLPPNPDRDSDAWTLAPGFELSPGGRLEGQLRVGWRKIRAVDAALPDFSDAVARARMTYKPGPETRIELELDRQPGYTVEGQSVYYLDTRSDTRLLHYLNRVLGLEIAGGLERLTFPGDDRRDRVARGELGVRLRVLERAIGRRVEYNLRLRHERRDSTNDAQDRSRTTLGVGAVLGY